MYRRYMMHWKYDLSKIKQRSYQSFDIGRIKSIVKGCLSSFVWIPSFNQIHNISHVNTDHLPKDKKMLGLIMLSSDTQNLSNFIKVSVKPKFDHFSKTFFSAFSDRSYSNLSFKRFYEKRLILSRDINKKRFFPLIVSN